MYGDTSVTSELEGRIPPHNNEAEAATIGALLLDYEAITVVLQYVRAEDFYKTSNQRIFSAITHLFNRSEAVDLITLTEELKKNGELEAAGGPAYISGLTSAVPTSANVEYYAKIVQECSLRRSLQRIASVIIANTYDESLKTRHIVDEAERKIFEISEDHQTGNFHSIREILHQTIEAIEKIYHTKENYTGIPSGFSELDSMTSGFQNSELIIIGARPSVGKTAFALSMSINMSIKHKIPVGFFTAEMANMAIVQRILSAEARLDSQKLRNGMLRQADFHAITEAAGRMYEAPLYIEDTPNISLLDLRAQARRMKSKYDVKIIIVDYLTLIRHEDTSIPRHEQVAEVSRSLKALSRELEIPVIVLSQVKRESEGKQPTLADLRESGSIEQDADVVIFLHRESNSDDDSNSQGSIPTKLIVAKQRNGPIGSLEIVFLEKYTKFESLSYESD